MVRVTDLLEHVGQQFVGADVARGDATDERADIETRGEQGDWSFSEALILDPSSDAVLEQVAEGTLSPDELSRETGFTPGEYLEFAVAAADGRLTVRALVAHTGWPRPVITDVLATLEEQGRLAIESYGRLTLVCLPERTTQARPRR